ncbi:FAD-dependent monooxygenase [Microbispora siamensis]
MGIAHTRDYATLSFSARTEELPPEPHLLRSLVTEMTSGWHPRIRQMLGDAAHAMSPAGGAGANLALRDAASLAAALASGRPLIPALRSYEREMIRSGFAAVRASAANGARILGQDPLPS